jgi:acetolactate synthase-1/2/3 large subunit
MTPPGATGEQTHVASGRETAHRLMETLTSRGVEMVFGVPGGGSNLDVVGAAEACGCRFVLTHTETAAAIMAGVTAELTGRLGACVASRGPGVATAVNGVAQAHLDRQPIVLVTDCVSTMDWARVSHQRVDHQTLLAAVTKTSLRWNGQDAVMLGDVVNVATSGRPGAVHIDVDTTVKPSTWSPAAAPPATSDVNVAREALIAARRPVVVAGVGATAMPAERRTAFRTALDRFLAGTGIPVLTTYKARGLLDDRGPNAAGVATGATIEAPVLDDADLIIGVGLDPIELIPAPWPYRAPVLLVGGWPTDDSTYFGDQVVAEIVGDLASLLDALAGSVGTTWAPGDAARYRGNAVARLEAAGSAPRSGLRPHDVVTIARSEAPAGTVATVDAGAHMLVAVPLWEVARPGELLVSSGLATMGFSLPAAIAAALVDPTGTVICFSGDGGLGLVLAELETLTRLALNVVVVVFNDASLSLIAIKQAGEGHGGDAATGYSPIDFAAIARGCGMASERVADAESYRRSLRAALGRRGPTLLDVTVDPSSYPAVLEAIRGRRS